MEREDKTKPQAPRILKKSVQTTKHANQKGGLKGKCLPSMCF